MKQTLATLALAGLALGTVGCSQGWSSGALARFGPQLRAVEPRGWATPGQDEQPNRAPGPPAADRRAWFRLTSARLAGPSLRRPGLRLTGLRRQDDLAGDDGAANQSARGRRSRPGPLPGLWGTIKRDVRDMPGDLWADTKAVYTSPGNLLILGAAYAGSLALQETGPDDTVEDSFRDGHSTFKHDWRDAFATAGNPGTHFALAGLWYLVGQQRQEDKTYQVGKTLFSALIINDLSTLVGQTATWDKSPNGEWGTVPSGHTSSSFTFASVMHQAYGAWVGAPLYALSALVAYERLESGEHYFADVIMGGVMGLVIGHTVASERELTLWGGQIVPYVDPYSQTSGIAWVKHFK